MRKIGLKALTAILTIGRRSRKQSMDLGDRDILDHRHVGLIALYFESSTDFLNPTREVAG